MPSTLDFHNFSWRGDPRWSKASSWTVYAPVVVVFIFAFSIMGVTLGSIWLVQLGNHLSV